MKKAILLFALFVSAAVSAQRVQEGESQLNAGFGFSSGGWGLPVYVGFDYGVHEDITIGLQASYASQTYKHSGFDSFKGTWFGIGANGNYHFNTVLDIPNEWDVYAGLTLAYNAFSYDYPNGYSLTYEGSGLGIAGQIGGRYYFSDNFGVNLEFGGGNIASGGKIGISYKF